MIQLPLISVVICTYNGEKYLRDTLSKLSEQTYPHYEVIVVDDGSTDSTVQIAHDFKVRLISHSSNQGLGVARNTGLAAARGEFIAYTDDDCLPARDWLEEIAKAFCEPRVMAVGGRTMAASLQYATERFMDASGYGNPAPERLITSGGLISRLGNYIGEMITPLHTTLLPYENLHAIYTLNAAYRTSMLRMIDGFDVRLRAAEDTDVSMRLHNCYPNWHIIFAPKALVAHRHRQRFFPWLRQTYARSQDSYVQFRSDDSFPPIYPFPVAILVLNLAVFIVKAELAVAVLALSPIVLYGWWQLRLAHKPLLDRIRFPFMQFMLETVTLAGYAVQTVRRHDHSA